MSEFKVGDVVQSKYGKDLKILDIGNTASYDFWGVDPETWAYCEDLTGNLPPIWYKISELMAKKGCECGAAHTVNKNCHMYYCPMHKGNK